MLNLLKLESSIILFSSTNMTELLVMSDSINIQLGYFTISSIQLCFESFSNILDNL